MPTHEQWQQQVEKVLRKSGLLAEGAPTPAAPETLLAETTHDGITVQPLYTADRDVPQAGVPGLAPFVRGSRADGCVAGGWDVRQCHAHPDAAATNREILADLAGGASSVWLRLGRSGTTVEDLPDALHGVHLDMAGVVLDADEHFGEAAEALLKLAAEEEVRPSALRGNLGADPISVHARTGQAADHAPVIDLARRCAESYTGLHAITVDGLPHHDAGGSDADELGCSMAAGVTYLRLLTAPAPAGAGLDIDTAAGLLEFRYAATVDQFLTIAKLRAARRMWERILRACGASEPARAQVQHAVTSSAMLTQRDPWVNMLRTTIAAFAAGVGGARAVTVQPFDAALGLPDGFSRRMARNTQSLLLEESHLAQVIDPAGGSYYVEQLTDDLARTGWEWFQRIEAAGGMSAALDSGLVADTLAATWSQRQESIADRSDPITGVSEFPDLDETPLRRDPAPESGDEHKARNALPRHRYAEDYERLRDAADRHLAESGRRPRVFLATLGSLAAYNARASFARNLFAAGGIEAPEAGVTESTRELVNAFTESGTSLVCLCSADKVYAERAEDAAQALKQAGASVVLLAGAPQDPPPAGVDGFVHTGGNALEILTDIHRRWGSANGAKQ
ncbi:heterodimeric methylmalonyl-CoA mutase small subunit [Halopolyspora algeriensis]|uniref:Heterodimeric methylmalonyl-CoA mutase small subunit n=2 Tax=Halopolyspora algeriensis TaxID=1500506 RepID=A0A368VQL4_9ACTN|nr:heterodimeric methylmalonyl-CoA mutase small subunit [Halopolyspora algeriensis]TQM56210.1 heterodimeric methylmalonyl-CoA mutase small subunit [Halopolyspora algeriensis]